jgi:hypothetical protein
MQVGLRPRAVQAAIGQAGRREFGGLPATPPDGSGVPEDQERVVPKRQVSLGEYARMVAEPVDFEKRDVRVSVIVERGARASAIGHSDVIKRHLGVHRPCAVPVPGHRQRVLAGQDGGGRDDGSRGDEETGA